MKLVGNLILTFAVIFGALAASTAYLAPLTLPDEQLIGLTLNQDVGLLKPPKDEDDYEPAVKKDTVLTAESLAVIRGNAFTVKGKESGVDFVQIKEFSFKRWPGRWVFIASFAALFVGSYFVKSASKREIAQAASHAADASTDTESPADALASLQRIVSELRRDLPSMTSEHDRLHAIVDRLDAAQKSHAPAFIDGRQTLVAALGLGGYAELMDRFAAAERQINRAWSAAADHVYVESADCLDQASRLLDEALAKMP